jgi:hypothetical protein
LFVGAAPAPKPAGLLPLLPLLHAALPSNLGAPGTLPRCLPPAKARESPLAQLAAVWSAAAAGGGGLGLRAPQGCGVRRGHGPMSSWAVLPQHGGVFWSWHGVGSGADERHAAHPLRRFCPPTPTSAVSARTAATAGPVHRLAVGTHGRRSMARPAPCCSPIRAAGTSLLHRRRGHRCRGVRAHDHARSQSRSGGGRAV